MQLMPCPTIPILKTEVVYIKRHGFALHVVVNAGGVWERSYHEKTEVMLKVCEDAVSILMNQDEVLDLLVQCETALKEHADFNNFRM